MPGFAFTEQAARRIARATQWAEREMGDTAQDYAPSPLRSQECWVKTPSSLPSGYSGTTALYGEVVVKNPEGNVTTTDYAFIRAIDNSVLSANTLLRGTFVGALTQSGMTAPLVQVGKSASPALVMGYYAGAAIEGAGGIALRKTPVTLFTGGTVKVAGHPWGEDCAALYTAIGTGEFPNQVRWQIGLRGTNADYEGNWNLIPFSFACEARYYGINGINIVECRKMTFGTPGSFGWKAWDPLALIPTDGSIHRVFLTTYPGMNYTSEIGWGVIAANNAVTIALSAG